MLKQGFVIKTLVFTKKTREISYSSENHRNAAENLGKKSSF